MEIKIIDKKNEGQRIVKIIKDGTQIQALEISSYSEAAIDIDVIKSLLQEAYNAGRTHRPLYVVSLEEC